MTGAQDEAVAVEPLWVVWVVTQMLGPEDGCHGSTTHRHSWVATLGPFHGIHCQPPNDINASSLKIV